RPAKGTSAALICGSRSDSVSTRLMSRATDLVSRARARETRSSTSGLRDTHDQRVALAAATAEGGGADATTTALEFEGEREHDAGTAHAERVTHGDGTTVDVDDLGIDTELARRRDADGRERLVDLDEVEVGGRDALLLAGLRDGARRLQLEGGVGASDVAERADLGEPLEAEFLGLGLAHDDHGPRTGGDPAGGAG